VLDNEVRRATGESPRWLTERQVTARHAGLTITGTVDLFDRSEGAVIDWKVVGVTTLRKAQSEGPSQAYRVQSQIYGLALQQEGFAVRTTSIAMLPRNGPLSSLLVMEEPYDQTIAEQALARLAAVTNTDWVDLAVSPSDSACRWCSVPWNLCEEGQLHR